MTAAESPVSAESSVVHRRQHSLVIDAPPEVLYDLVADVTRWPVLFEPTVRVELIEKSTTSERFELSALVNDELATWRSRRTFDRGGLLIRFAQERSTPPMTAMSGDWSFISTVAGKTEVVLRHEYSVADDAPDAVAWVNRALDTNSERELAALARVAELHAPLDHLVFKFEETLPLRGSAADAFELVARGDLWSERLPHVIESVMDETSSVQRLTTSTVTPDGSRHTTSSIRLITPGEGIVFKQTLLPAFLIGHAGDWRFHDGPGGSTVTVRHIVAVNPQGLEALLGPGSSLDDARVWTTESLSKNSRITASYASVFAEGRASAPTDDADISA